MASLQLRIIKLLLGQYINRAQSFCIGPIWLRCNNMNLKVKACILAISSLSIILVFSFTLLLQPVAAASNSVNIFPPGAKPYGLTYAEHAKNFQKWVLSIPAKDNPINDETGVKCTNGQQNTNSSVFYLAFNNGGASQRTCVVPAGKGLLIPVMEAEASQKEAPGSSVQDLDKGLKKDQDSVNSLYLQIGDKVYSYNDLLKYRTHTDVFNVVFPDKAIYGIIKGGPSKAIADGFYIITQPLAKGTYPIQFKSSLLCQEADCSEPNFAQDIKYTIIAQ